MATASEVASRPTTAERQSSTSTIDMARAFRWRVVDDPPPSPEPTRYQRLYTWLYEFNRY